MCATVLRHPRMLAFSNLCENSGDINWPSRVLLFFLRYCASILLKPSAIRRELDIGLLLTAAARRVLMTWEPTRAPKFSMRNLRNPAEKTLFLCQRDKFWTMRRRTVKRTETPSKVPLRLVRVNWSTTSQKVRKRECELMSSVHWLDRLLRYRVTTREMYRGVRCDKRKYTTYNGGKGNRSYHKLQRLF